MDIVEEWKPVPGYEKYCEASNMGDVKGFERTVNVPSKNYVYTLSEKTLRCQTYLHEKNH